MLNPLLGLIQSDDMTTYRRETLNKEDRRETTTRNFVGKVSLVLVDTHISQLLGQFFIAEVPALQLGLQDALNPACPVLFHTYSIGNEEITINDDIVIDNGEYISTFGDTNIKCSDFSWLNTSSFRPRPGRSASQK
jgi:hypothetical protein